MQLKAFFIMVGTTGFEPATTYPPDKASRFMMP